MSDFIDRLTYLLSLSRDGKRKNKDYSEMVRLLKLEGHWKAKPRGPVRHKFKYKNNLCAKSAFPVYNKQGSMTDEQLRQKEYFEGL